MRNCLLLVLSVLALSSCATHKYGCGLSQTTTQLKPTLVSGFPENEKRFVTVYSTVNNVTTTHKYIPSPINIYRGYGEVSVVDTFRHPYTYLIRVGGSVIKNDNASIEAKYVIAYEGKFTDQLKPNVGRVVYFECKSAHNIYAPAEMIEVVDGCVEQVIHNFVRKDGTIVFHKM